MSHNIPLTPRLLADFKYFGDFIFEYLRDKLYVTTTSQLIQFALRFSWYRTSQLHCQGHMTKLTSAQQIHFSKLRVSGKLYVDHCFYTILGRFKRRTHSKILVQRHLNRTLYCFELTASDLTTIHEQSTPFDLEKALSDV